MVKDRKKKRSPSRERYEAEHPTTCFRTDRETRDCLKEYLKVTGCSFADFVKDGLGREKSMVDKRVEIMASRQLAPSVEDRLRCLEDLVYDILSLRVDTDKYPPYCPRCEGQHMLKCEGREIASKIAHPWVPTWKCPKCGFFINTYHRIDPKSIRWNEPRSVKHIHRPTVPVKPGAKKPK